jgi:hypothetical protein
MYNTALTPQEVEHGEFKMKDMGIYQSNNTWRMGLHDLTKESKNIVDTMQHTYDLFNVERETEYINENRPRIWFWKNVSFVFSIGSIFEQTDNAVFDELMLFFDRHQDTFFPNQCLVYDFRHSAVVENIEITYDISPGNYHILMSIIVNSDTDLDNAPETIYSSFGPVITLTNMQEIVSTILELFAKYGAVKQFMEPTLLGTMGISYDMSKGGQHGMPREFLKDESIRRMYRKGFLDLEANDGYELVNPDFKYHPGLDQRQWFDEDEDGLNFRKPAKHKERSKGAMAYIKKNNTHNSLYNQLHNKTQIITKEKPEEMKAVQYKVDFYRETEQNQKDKPTMQIYNIENYDKLSTYDQFIENTMAREKEVICPHMVIMDQDY